MATCKKCVHDGICQADGGSLRHGLLFTRADVESVCDHFEERAQFMKLPCKIGDILWADPKILPTDRLAFDELPKYIGAEVISFRRNRKGFWIKLGIWATWLEWVEDNECGPYEEGICRMRYFSFPISVIGTSVFYTQEEAEVALAKRKEAEE